MSILSDKVRALPLLLSPALLPCPTVLPIRKPFATVSEATVKSTAELMLSTGLAAAGYKYIVIDGENIPSLSFLPSFSTNMQLVLQSFPALDLTYFVKGHYGQLDSALFRDIH